MVRRGLIPAVTLMLALAWSLVIFRIVVHLVPPNLDNPAVHFLLVITAPLVGLPPGDVSDFALFREGLLRPVVAAVVLALITLGASAFLGGRELDRKGH